MGKLSLVLAGVDGGRGQHARAHADGHLVHDAGVGAVIHGVPGRALRGHQVSHGARGAQGSGGRVRVQVGLAGQVGGRQVGVNGAVAGAVVREGVRGLSYGGGDVGLLPPVTACALCREVLLGLRRDSDRDTLLTDKRWLWASSAGPGSLPAAPGKGS